MVFCSNLPPYLLLQTPPANATEDSSGSGSGSSDDDECSVIKRCVDRSREILECIDRQVAEAQNVQKLAEIQKNIDLSGLEKMPDSAISKEYRVSGTIHRHRVMHLVHWAQIRVGSLLHFPLLYLAAAGSSEREAAFFLSA
jgi:hypothetical protein